MYYIDQVGGAVDLVIADLVMPEMGGKALTEQLAERYPKIPVVWMSGHPREIETQNSAASKARAFLQKPVSPHRLLQMVSQVLPHQASSR
jgi:two-component system cell cycle sensor histidine kinase/response regulator CckA